MKRAVRSASAGYPSGLEELSCRSEFDLPSQFLVLFARALWVGLRDTTQRAACAVFYAAQSLQIENAYTKR